MYRRDIWFCNSKNMYKQNTFWVIFFRSSGPLEPRHHPTYYSRKPMNYWFSIETHKHVYTNETFYSMYGWYGSNAHYMWKIANFGWFLMIFGPLEPRYDPISYVRLSMNDYFIFGTLNRVWSNEKFDSMHGWYGFHPQIMWKIQKQNKSKHWKCNFKIICWQPSKFMGM